jgi:hypothetical protein
MLLRLVLVKLDVEEAVVVTAAITVRALGARAAPTRGNLNRGRSMAGDYDAYLVWGRR